MHIGVLHRQSIRGANDAAGGGEGVLVRHVTQQYREMIVSLAKSSEKLHIFLVVDEEANGHCAGVTIEDLARRVAKSVPYRAAALFEPALKLQPCRGDALYEAIRKAAYMFHQRT